MSQTLTSGRAHLEDGQVNLFDIGNQRDLNTISDEIVYNYIRWSSDEIDSALSQIYRTPFRKLTHGESVLDVDINEYNPDQIILSDPIPVAPGDEVIMISTQTSPPTKVNLTVNTIEDEYTFTVNEEITFLFQAEYTRVVKIGYPPPIKLSAARLAAAHIFDKYFSAQASPNISEYGTLLRDLAYSNLNDILSGVIVLLGVERIPHRFASPYLMDRVHLLRRDGNDNRSLNKGK